MHVLTGQLWYDGQAPQVQQHVIAVPDLGGRGSLSAVDDDALLQAVLDMSMLEAAAAASSPLAAAIAPDSQDAQLSAAAPALGGDDNDAELRAAIQASLQELQPASLAAQASGAATTLHSAVQCS